LKITEVKTHLVHCPIPENERVRSGAGLKLARQAASVEIDWDFVADHPYNGEVGIGAGARLTDEKLKRTSLG